MSGVGGRKGSRRARWMQLEVENPALATGTNQHRRISELSEGIISRSGGENNPFLPDNDYDSIFPMIIREIHLYLIISYHIYHYISYRISYRIFYHISYHTSYGGFE